MARTMTRNTASARPAGQSEADIRLNMLNTLLTTPHRDLNSVFPVHAEMIKQDPLFYVRLAAWYNRTGEIRDHKEMFIVNLCLSNFPGHRDVGLAMLRMLPPYQVTRVVDFIHGKEVNKVTKTKTGVGKNAKTTSTVTKEKLGLYRNVPRSMATEVERYLKEREADAEWFDSTVLVARKYIKRLYALLHVKPSDRAQKILFDETPPEDSKAAVVKALRDAKTPADEARIIVENKVPYRMASTIVSAMTPTVLAALISVMSDQELISNLGSLKERGAMDNADLKKLITERLDKAKTGKRVAALKTTTAKEAVNLSEDIKKQLDAVGDTQLKSKGRINRPTAIIIDKSGSMNIAIKLGKQMAATISAIMDAPLYVYAADTMPYPIESQGTDLASWERAFAGITANGRTSCGAGIQMLIRQRQRVENIIMITDEGENTSPLFVPTFQQYCREMAITPNVLFLKAGDGAIVDKLEQQCKVAGIAYDTYDFKGDYYSLPSLVPYLTKPTKMDLLMEIMTFELPKRRAA